MMTFCKPCWSPPVPTSLLGGPAEFFLERPIDTLQLTNDIQPMIGHVFGPLEADMTAKVEIEPLHCLRDGGFIDAKEVSRIPLATPLFDEEPMELSIIDSRWSHN